MGRAFIGRSGLGRLLSILLVVLAVGGDHASFAGPLEDATAAYARKDYTSAIRIWRDLAEAGDPAAQLSLGSMYDSGIGVDRNPDIAFQLFQSSAESGNAAAQFALATCYANGRGTARDIDAAVQWYEESADQGYPNAQLNLGVLYLGSPRPAPQNPVLAFKWLEIAAANASSPDYVSRWAASLREDLMRDMEPGQVEEARKLVREWHSKRDPKQQSLP